MKKSILIVDDDQNIVMLQRKLLQVLGYSDVAVAEDGFQALHFMAEIEPDLVFLDIMMPGLDGWLICEILNRVERWQHIPVILQSALEGSESIRKGIELGAYGFLQKPLAKDNLKAILDSLFEREVPYPANINSNLEPVLIQVTEAAKQTFNLILGVQAEILNVKVLNVGMLEHYWDYLAEIQAHGVIGLELSTGWPEGLAGSIASALQATPVHELEEESISETQKDVMQIMLGTALRALTHVVPGKAADAITSRSGSIPVDRSAKYKYVMDIRVDKWEFPLVVTANF